MSTHEIDQMVREAIIFGATFGGIVDRIRKADPHRDASEVSDSIVRQLRRKIIVREVIGEELDPVYFLAGEKGAP